MGVSLGTLPFDVVLRVFHYLSACDIVRTCQTCRSLRTNLEEHHVWLELAEKYCFKNASVARYILSLTARSTDELRAFVAGQARLDRHWVEKTILTNPPVCFRFQAPTPSLFCELLPGGEYLTLVHRNGDISLLSLADLDNVHQIFKLPASLPTGGVHTVSLTTDYKGCPLLVLSMYGTPRRLFCTTVETETRSINLVRCLEIEVPVLDIAVQHNTIACLCWPVEPNAFSFLVTTIDDTVDRALLISQVSAEITSLHYYSICLPTPTTLLLFQASNIRCYHLPDVSGLPPGNHRLPQLSPIWSWESHTFPKARLAATSAHWDPDRTAPTVVTFLCDFLRHTVTLHPSEKSPGSSHLDVIDHTCINIRRAVSTPYLGLTLLKSYRGIWFRPGNTTGRAHDFLPFSTDDVQRTGLVRLDISKVGMREHLVPTICFDEISGRIVVLARALEGDSYADYVFVVDMS